MNRVLLIDDDNNMHKLMECFVKLHAKDVSEMTSVYTLEDAIALLKRERFDFIFLDNRLDRIADIRTTLPVLRHLTRGAKLFVISADVDQPYLLREQTEGVTAVIDKFELRAEIAAGLLEVAA
ncbi:MAG: hypothetical protein Rhirs2KO_20820 [Rhizobiaceae bacterium]